MAWDQREVELERQLDAFDRQQNEILSAAQKVCTISPASSAAWSRVLNDRNSSKSKVILVGNTFLCLKYKWSLTSFKL